MKRKTFSKQDVRLIQDFINEIDNDIKVYKGSRFECDIYEEKIFLGSKRFSRINELFCNWLSEKIDFEPNYCVIAILHELGHIMTNTEELQDNREKLDSIYTFMYENNVITEKEYFKNYFEIPAEFQATMWGVDFYKQNFAFCENLAKLLKS